MKEKYMKRCIIAGLILAVILLALTRCSKPQEKEKEKNADDTVIQIVEEPEVTFYTYEEVYTYYSMLEEKKGELKDEIVEFFLATDPEELNQQGYARYYGNLGRRLIQECQRFKKVVYAGGGDKDLPRHVYHYEYFYTNNEIYYKTGLALVDVEKNLNESQYDKTLNNLKDIYNHVLKMGETENEQVNK